MRIAVLIAVSALVAGCSQHPAGQTGATQLTPITHGSPKAGASPSGSSSASSSASPSASSSASSGSAEAPAKGASAAEAIAWVQAGPPVDDADFRVALRNGATVSLGEDTAFTTPFGTTCMTDLKRVASGLACLVNLTDPPPQPADVYGVWKGGWVDFDGAGVRVGSAHGDPGRFNVGNGPPLPPGGSVSFGDFRCRTDASVLVCANYARQTAVRYSDDGIEVFGCSRQNPPQAGIGIQYSC